MGGRIGGGANLCSDLFLFFFFFFCFGGCDLMADSTTGGCGLIFIGCDGLMLVGGSSCGLILVVVGFFFFLFFFLFW